MEAAEEERNLVNKDGEKENTDIVLKDNVIISKSLAALMTLSNATKTTVLMALNALSNNPEIQEKLHDEIDEKKRDVSFINYLRKIY